MASRSYAENEEEDEPPKTFWTRFTQQRLRAWQCVLAPKWVIAIYLVCGIIFSGLGIVLLLISWSVAEHVYDYTDVIVDENTHVGEFNITIVKDMQPPIWVYYSLDRFHQNHRRYIKSRDSTQLKEVQKPKLKADNLEMCRPWVTQGGGQGFAAQRVNYPCGLIARSVFNDTYDIRVKGPSEADPWLPVEVDSSADSIAWSADTSGKFRNLDPEAKTLGSENQVHLNMWINQRFPPVQCRQKEITKEQPFVPVTVGMRQMAAPGSSTSANPEMVDVVDCKGYMAKDSKDFPRCNFMRSGKNFTCEGNYYIEKQPDWGIESGHFIVWMRIAGLPTFRKLWGKINTELKAGSTLRVHYVDNFPVKPFYGNKAFVISTATMLGGRNDFLGYGYLVVGACCLLFGIGYFWRHMVKPRPLGDIGLLSHCQ